MNEIGFGLDISFQYLPPNLKVVAVTESSQHEHDAVSLQLVFAFLETLHNRLPDHRRVSESSVLFADANEVSDGSELICHVHNSPSNCACIPLACAGDEPVGAHTAIEERALLAPVNAVEAAAVVDSAVVGEVHDHRVLEHALTAQRISDVLHHVIDCDHHRA